MIKFFDKLYSNEKEEFYKIVNDNLKNDKKMFIVTANPETFINGNENLEFSKLLLDSNTTIIPDGIGIVKAAHILGYKVKEKIPGVDLAEELLKICNENKYKLALLGAKKEVVEAFNNIIKEKYPNIILVKIENGYIENKDLFFQELTELEPDVCLVALGIPYQEKLIYKHLNKFKKGVFVGVGGSFDVLSGTKKRAPKIFQKLNIEWLYRIVKEPKRLKRFWNNNVKFLMQIHKKKMKK